MNSKLYEALGYNPEREIGSLVLEALKNGRRESDIRNWVEDAIYAYYNTPEEEA